jgi:hypothetical protein
VATAIRGAIIQAKMAVVPVRRGYWGNKIGKVHTVPIKSTGKCGSVTIRLIPAPRGAGIVAARTPKKVLQMAGIEDCYTCSRGSRKTLGNFVRATYYALASTYGFLSPDLWTETKYTKAPLQEFTGEGGAAGSMGAGQRARQTVCFLGGWGVHLVDLLASALWVLNSRVPAGLVWRRMGGLRAARAGAAPP